ncbi:hypothetical protein PVAP13_6NG129003 [Panicum virgatum]|uniref:DUF7769 domain-containing protein n=1 Tax=Panicum virgatum TaxID=38727 RepID=A0A8T0QXF3_PANVG|nr:hypothetical protein PVAP13_6NG129003 [Panicum virgatum]
MADSFPGFDLNEAPMEHGTGIDLNAPVVENDDDAIPVLENDAPVLEADDADGLDLNAFDLNLPLDEFGAMDFDFVQTNLEQAVEAPVQANNRRNREMSDELRKQVYQALLARNKNGKLGKKDTSIVAECFGVHIEAVQRLVAVCPRLCRVRKLGHTANLPFAVCQ